jgi:4-amino-4-deoxy-L-arabinose transferase-like glycosyltransferase
MGPLFAALGAGLLLNHAAFQTMAAEFLRNYPLIFLSGLISLGVGLALVLTHNVWTRDWRLIITIFGWLAVIGGVLRIVTPQLAAGVGGVMLVHTAALVIAAFVWLALGAILCFFGYRRSTPIHNGSPK